VSLTGRTTKNNHRLDSTADFGSPQDHALSTTPVASPSTRDSQERIASPASTVKVTAWRKPDETDVTCPRERGVNELLHVMTGELA